MTQAVSLIGMSQLESLVLSIGVGSALPHQSASGYDFIQFWRAAARRGTLARTLATVLCPARQSECFSAGFLQDMALPFLAQQNPEEYESILKQWNDGEGEIIELERSRFEWDHAEVATWICNEWDLPESIASAVGGHHGGDEQIYDCPPPVSLVAHIRENEQMPCIEALIEDAHSKYGMSVQRVNELIETSFQNAEELARLMG
jgi:HD-like signal output (HDOD) protein